MDTEKKICSDVSRSELEALKVEPYHKFYLDSSTVVCDTDDDGEVGARSSPFVDSIEPIYFHTMTPVKFATHAEGKKTTYIPPTGFDFLLYSYHKFKFPAVKIANPELYGSYQIRWSEDSCYHIISSAITQIGGMNLCKMDNMWCVFDSQYLRDNNHSYSINRDCGNTPDLNEWGEELPQKKLSPPQPWWYSRGFNWAFPLHKLNSLNKFSHVYTYQPHVNKLLSMRSHTESGWVEIPTNLKLVSIKDKNDNDIVKIKNIEMYGMMADITPAEKEDIHVQKSMYIFEDIIPCKGTDKYKYGTTAEIDLSTTNGITTGIFWAAQNLKAVAHNDHSNFTTNSSDKYKGKNPLKSVTLLHGGVEKFKDVDANDFSGSLARFHFKSTPRMEGLGAYSYPTKNRARMDMGINAKDLKPKWKATFKKSDNKDEFALHVRCQVRKFLLIDQLGNATVMTSPKIAN